MINLHFIFKVLSHYASATRIDVLHSPFVYTLYNQCIRKQQTQPDWIMIEQLRINALRNKKQIIQNDYGASGFKQPLKKHKVSYLAAKHAKPSRIAQILNLLVKHYHLNHAIELGTSLGFTSAYIAKALPENGLLHTVEGAPEIAALANEHFKSLGIEKKIVQHVQKFDDILPHILTNLPKLDLAFIDGNHTYQATINYFNSCLPYVHNSTVLVMDDIYWSKEMTKAWEEIKLHPQVTVTVDLFFIGLVFFRTEQAKEHFKLRIW